MFSRSLNIFLSDAGLILKNDINLPGFLVMFYNFPNPAAISIYISACKIYVQNLICLSFYYLYQGTAKEPIDLFFLYFV